MTASPNLIAYLALTMASILWGASFIAMKIALTGFDPMVIVFGRMALCFAILLPFAGRLRAQCVPARGDFKLLVFMGLCEPCLYFVFEAKALTLTSASQAGMITATLPLMTSVAAIVLLKEKVGLRTFAGFALAVAGVVWLSAGSVVTENAPNPVLGNILEVLAMASAVGGIITIKHLSVRYCPMYLTLFMAGMGAVFFLPALFLPGTQMPTSFPLLPSLAVIFLGTAVTLGAYFCYNYGIRVIPANQAAAFINLIPVLTALLGWSLLGEVFTTQQLMASALVLSGILLSQKNGR